MLVIADSCHSVQVGVLQDVVDGGEDGWLAAQEVGEFFEQFPFRERSELATPSEISFTPMSRSCFSCSTVLFRKSSTRVPA